MKHKNLEKELDDLAKESDASIWNIAVGKFFLLMGPICASLGTVPFVYEYLSKGKISSDSIENVLVGSLLCVPLELLGGVTYFMGKRRYNKTRKEYYQQTLFPDYFL